MNNRITEIFNQCNIKPASFAKANGIKTSTMYSITRGQTKFENISVGVFIKIANGLGMTVEELFYGEDDAPRQYADKRQQKVNDSFIELSERGKAKLAEHAEDLLSAESYSKNEEGDSVSESA